MEQSELQGLVDTLLMRLDTMESTVEQVSNTTAEMWAKWDKKKEQLSLPSQPLGEDLGFIKVCLTRLLTHLLATPT